MSDAKPNTDPAATDDTEPNDDRATGDTEPTESKPLDDRALWLPVWIIMAGVGSWGAYHTVGALRSDENWKLALTKALIIFGCVAGFLTFWAVALMFRARRLRS